MRLPKLPNFRIPKLARPRGVASDVFDLAGLGCLDGAAWWLRPIVGLVVLGAFLLLIGRAVSE